MDYFKKIERSVTISADKRSTVDLQVDIWSQDLNVTKFILKLDTVDSTPIDLTNAAVRVVMVYNQDDQDVKIEAAGIVEDVATQKIAYVMSDKLAGFEGEVTAGFYVTLKTGQRIDVQNVTFNMCKSLLDKELEAATENYYQTFDDIAKDVRNQADTQKSAMLAKTNEVTFYGDTQKTAINNIVKDVQSTGNTAKTQIGQVLPDVQSKVSAINTELAKIDENMPDLFVAYANSADGTVDFTKIKPKENLLVLKNKIVRSYVSNMGELVKSDNYTASDYISVEGLKTYQLYFENNITVSGKTGQHWLGYNFYDSNKNYIVGTYKSLYNDTAYSGLTKTNNTFNAPSNAAYIRISWTSIYDYKIKFEESETPTTYLPSPTDNYRNSFVKYIGYGVKNSNNPSDYRWGVNPEWQRAQLDYEKASMIQDKLVNLIVNGDFSNGLSSWYLYVFGEIENYQNKLKFSTDSTQGNHAFRTYFSESLKKNHKYYLKFDLDMSDGYLNTADFYFEKAGGYFDKVIQIENNRSFLIDLTVDADMLYFATRGTSVGYILLDNVELYNLTSIFGAGNEPSLEEFERLLSINVNNPTIYSQSILKAELNSNPINSILTTLSAENPSTTLGGTWTQLGTESKFNQTIYYWKRTQ